MAGEWVAKKGEKYFSEVFGADWKLIEPGVYQGVCPGNDFHSTGKGARDCRVYVSFGPQGQKPGAFCFHQGCKGYLDQLNQKYRALIFAKDENFQPRKRDDDGVAREPVSQEAWVPQYDEDRLREFVKSVPEITEEWLVRRSPVDPRNVTPGEFLEYCFLPGERVLIFSNFFSQGDFGWKVGSGGARLGAERGIAPVKSKIPSNGGDQGVWYLSQPVDGLWHPNPRNGGKYSRRSEESVTRWCHLVMESDKAPADLWFKFLAYVEFPIKAIYSSAGKSWHALVEIPADHKEFTKPHMDAFLRDRAKRILPIYGADPGALTPVRLTRLPGCSRKGKLQKLIYLNPNPKSERILNMVPRRDI